MKINLFKPILRKNSWRTGVALVALVCLTSLGLSQNPTEPKDRKRITSLQIGEAAEGSRVTIVSDSALNDYEAFRRGDRFYVRIPLADFAAAQPSFQGDGFDDVQVQIVGDSTVISFKLQPGSSARVDQRTNRLDVIFSSPAHMARSNSGTAVRSRVISSNNGSRNNAASTSQRRASDLAGPVPPDSPTYDTRVVSESTDENRFADTQTSINRQVPSGRDSQQNKLSSQPGAVQATATPGLSVPSSTTSTYPPLTGATPLTATPSTTNGPAVAATSVWKARSQTALQWARANSMATLLGSIALLGVVAFLAVLMLRRRKVVVKTKRANVPKAQPKYSQDLDFEDMVAEDVRSDNRDNSFETIGGSAEWDSEATFNSSPAATVHMEQELRERIGRLTEPSLPPLEVGTQQEQPWTSVESATRYSGTYENLEQEREVIEL
ncbi:MAG: hypothetical protein M3539_02965 [Acidobacteriota bacterium]|nr:hypothetical protein [Acidobacteriota bacterium]